jgi:hypothetical protein
MTVKLPADDRARFFRLLSLMEEMGARDMGNLSEGQAKQFHAATDIVRDIANDNEDEEAADYCAACDHTHWPSDENEDNSTWQQWQCQECGAWNDRA